MPADPRALRAEDGERLTDEDLRALMRDPRYWRTRDPEFVRRVTDGFRRLMAGEAALIAPPEPLGQRAAIRAEEVARRAARIERYAEQRRAEAGNWAPGSTLHADVLAHAEAIAGDATTLRELAAANAALVKERDALREEWVEIAAGLTDEQPEVGALWPLVSEVSGALSASRNLFRNEIAAHNRTKTERDAALASAERLEEALRKIASCTSHHPDDVISVARAALAREPQS